MKVPNHIKRIAMRRAWHAEQFMKCDWLIVDWMEKKGINVSDPQFSEHILTGAESLCNPYSSAAELEYMIAHYEPKEES